MSAWKELYCATVLETNRDTLEKMVHKTEEAIYLRTQELFKSSNGGSERHEIVEASAALLILKHERLGWPGFGSI